MEDTQETTTLIAADKVEGTKVYDPDRQHLGDIHEVMIDKVSGRVAYAVMSFGGFLGIGERYHPIPWSTLKYDTSMEGYVINLARDELEGGPTYDVGAVPRWGDRDYETELHDYYRQQPYWLP